MLPRRVATVVEVPQLRPLPTRVPRTEGVADREDPLLGARLLLVASPAAEHGVEAVPGDGVQQRHGLQGVARPVGALAQSSVVDVVLHGRHDQAHAQPRDGRVAIVEELREVVPRVDVQQRERQRRRREGLHGEVQHDDRVLAAGEEDHRPLELPGHLPHDVDRLGLEVVQMVQPVCRAPGTRARRRLGGCLNCRGRPHHGGHWCNPHSVLARPDQRPARGSSPSATGRVHGSHPMEA